MSDELNRREALSQELVLARRELGAERSRRESAERMATGALELCAAHGTAELVKVLTDTFRLILGAEEAFVLVGKRGGPLRSQGSSDERFADLEWEWDAFAERVADGRAAIVIKAERVPGWIAQGTDVFGGVGSSLHARVSGGDEVVILVCVHSQAAQFDRDDATRVERITKPLEESWQRARAGEREERLRRDSEENNVRLEMARAELLVARDQAEQATKAKSSFLARMSHQLRTPLSAVIGLTDLALDTDLEPDPLDYIQSARASATHLLSILNDILDFSKVEAGELAIENVPLNIPELLEEVARYAEVLMQETDAVLRTECVLPQMMRPRIGDPLRIKQVLLNLVANAVKFTAEGEILIRVEEGRPGFINIKVSDTGTGMTPDVRAEVFEPFSQAEDSTQRRFGGTGLGLTISRDLTELMGGSVLVEGEAGVGSSFTVMLPLPVVERRAEVREETPMEQQACVPSLRILVAEDHRVNQLIALRMLEALGHEVTTVEDGQAAVDAAVKDDFDMILMDMQMPIMNGLEATEELRRRLPNGLTIVALTANAIAGDRERCMEAGMTDYLAKPVSKSKLSAMIAKHWAA